MEVCSEINELARKEFIEKWEVLYKTSILKQQKWFSSNHNLKKGDIVQILDLKEPFNYARLANVSQVEVNRYYTLEYKAGKNFVTIKRAAQSLCFVMSKEQCEGSEPAINDSIACLSEDDMPIKNAKNKVKFKFQQNVDQIINSLS